MGLRSRAGPRAFRSLIMNVPAAHDLAMLHESHGHRMSRFRPPLHCGAATHLRRSEASKIHASAASQDFELLSRVELECVSCIRATTTRRRDAKQKASGRRPCVHSACVPSSLLMSITNGGNQTQTNRGRYGGILKQSRRYQQVGISLDGQQLKQLN